MQNSKNYLNVPYAEKDQAKALGARWDPAKKKWYVLNNIDMAIFSRWLLSTSISDKSDNNTKPKPTTNKIISRVTTYAKDKNFVAYNGDKPPWD